MLMLRGQRECSIQDTRDPAAATELRPSLALTVTVYQQ